MDISPSLLAVALSWRTLLDIILITTGMFFLLLTLARLGTWKIMAGIFLALVVFIGANLLHLQGIEWIYNNVSHVALIGLIVIFQPELRKVLERAVWAPPKLTPAGSEQLSRLVADCLVAMAKDCCGALIVYPGREPIGDKITGGFELNAEPSYPLILSLFDDSSPGHDGALIVEGDRLARFGVRLPMSTTTRLADSYGTRHHAAMGMAEQSDALVLVVSEERGQMAAFYESEMLPLEGQEAVCQLINAHLERIGQVRRKRKSRVFNKVHFLLVMISLFTATALSLSVLDTSRNIVERSVSAPVDYTQSTVDGSVLVGDRGTEVILHLSGPLTDMDELRQRPPHVNIDLSTLEEGRHSVVITSENLNLPKSITLLDVSPAQLDLTLVPMERKNLPITPQLIGKLPGGLKLKKVSVSPETVLVTLPKVKKGQGAFKILTTPIYLDSISADSSIFCGVAARPAIQPVSKSWPNVEVRVEVESVTPPKPEESKKPGAETALQHNSKPK